MTQTEYATNSINAQIILE